jgi:outer membrane protein OmpA-like peptidoglycan-associated protein
MNLGKNTYGLGGKTMNKAIFRTSVATLFGVSLVLLAAQTVTAAVDCERLHVGDRVPTVQELTECLTAVNRGIRVIPEGTQEATVATPSVASLKVSFEFASYSLTPGAKAELQKLGAALKSSELRNDSFLIEGHTDSVGGASYNQRLSMFRAQAVKEYLVEVVGIESDRLMTVGLGEQQLLNQSEPVSSVNRRVQIVNQSTQ